MESQWHGRRKLAGWILALGVAALLGLAATATAADRMVSGPGFVGTVIDEPAAETTRFWTDARLARARPAPDAFGPGASGAGPSAAARTASFEVPDPSGIATRMQGKVFYERDGALYVCSGTAVESLNESAVVTAGHCVADEGSFATNWIFVPAYRDGERPFGTWGARAMYVAREWFELRDGNSDFAAVAVALDGHYSLHDTVGARRIAFGQPRPAAFSSFGYPAAPPFDGQRMRTCSGPNLGADPATGSSHLAEPGVSMACDMTPGSSGGGWFGPDAVLASVASHSHPGDPNTKYGPYLREGLRATFEAAANEGGPPPPPPGPETVITGRIVKNRKATIRFQSYTEGTVRFECQLDARPWAACTSPTRFRRLRPGRHRFAVVGIDEAGIRETTPAVAKFKVKRKRKSRR